VDDGAPRSRGLDLGPELARALGYEHWAIGHNVTLRKGRYGNATLSRWPIQRERNIDLTVGFMRRRGCQHTRIAVRTPVGKTRRLEAFNLHLGLSARERERQVTLLARSREFAALPFGTPTIVAGDYNDWRSLLRPFFVDMLGFRSATGGNTVSERAIATFPSFFPQGSLDRIYYRGPLRLAAAKRCRLGLSRVASDHLPVIVDFDLSRNQGGAPPRAPGWKLVKPIRRRIPLKPRRRPSSLCRRSGPVVFSFAVSPPGLTANQSATGGSARDPRTYEHHGSSNGSPVRPGAREREPRRCRGLTAAQRPDRRAKLAEQRLAVGAGERRAAHVATGIGRKPLGMISPVCETNRKPLPEFTPRGARPTVWPGPSETVSRSGIAACASGRAGSPASRSSRWATCRR
jgi:endonuclease/exonuclease/phosphatase family metal-dependent hydrolase